MKKSLESAYPVYEMLVREAALAFVGGDGYSPDTELLKKEMGPIKQLKNFSREPIKALHETLVLAYDETIRHLTTNSEESWLKAQEQLMRFVEQYYLL